ncbi:MAG: hypothetical protein AAF685_15140 [Cyanobacteria bacterium P01_C01_bin.89]
MTDYQKGHYALQIFEIGESPRNLKIWIFVSIAWILFGLFFAWHHPIARWVVGGWAAGVASLVAATFISKSVLFRLSGFLALTHVVFWSPALYMLLTERPFLTSDLMPYSIWSGGVTAIMVFSYIFDIPYSFMFLRHVFLRK